MSENIDSYGKPDIITNEKLEEMGVYYGSREKYEAELRKIDGKLASIHRRRGLGIDLRWKNNEGVESVLRKSEPAVPESELSRIKGINIVGSHIGSRDGAARIFSAFRDPRYEIFNIIYTAGDGEILAHSAWTTGLPNKTKIIDSGDLYEGFDKIRSLIERLNADKIWIAHNHPSGMVSESIEDIAATYAYQNFFNDSFAGHIVLDHDKYNLIYDGRPAIHTLAPPAKNYVSADISSQDIISTPHMMAEAFQEILNQEPDINALSVLDARHRIIAWNYLDESATADSIAKFMKLSAGSCIMILSNNQNAFDHFEAMSEQNREGRNSFFLDVILANNQGEQNAQYHRTNWAEYYLGKHPDVLRLIHNEPAKLTLQRTNDAAATTAKAKKDIPEDDMPDVSESTAEAVGSTDVSEEIIEGRGEPKTPEEVAFLNTLHQRRVITESLENGKLSCLPGAGGFADTSPAVNIANDTRYHGVNLLYLKDFQARNGFPTAEYVTRDQIDKARTETGDQIFIRKDQKPVTVSFKVQNEGTGEWEQKNALLYNVAQTTKPWALKDWAEKHVQERQQEKQEYLKQQYGDQYQPREPRRKEPGPEITCSTTEPEKYLGQYLAAVSMGGKFTVSPEQAKEFAANLKDAVFERGGNDHTDPFKLSKICQAAGQECKEVMREIGREQRQNREQAQEQKQEQKISRGRSR